MISSQFVAGDLAGVFGVFQAEGAEPPRNFTTKGRIYFRICLIFSLLFTHYSLTYTRNGFEIELLGVM